MSLALGRLDWAGRHLVVGRTLRPSVQKWRLTESQTALTCQLQDGQCGASARRRVFSSSLVLWPKTCQPLVRPQNLRGSASNPLRTSPCLLRNAAFYDCQPATSSTPTQAMLHRSSRVSALPAMGSESLGLDWQSGGGGGGPPSSSTDTTLSASDFDRGKSGNLSPLQSGALYLVGTPIGNLEDISFRALRVLRSADLILAEDTRHSGKLLSYFGIKTSMISFHLHNEQSREAEVLQKLRAGKIVAVISDAGMPGISDPGMELVEACVGARIPIIPVPGPSAVITALVASGLPTFEFTFVGFLPPDKSPRRKRLASMKESKPTQIMFVGPHKLAACLTDAAEVIGPERRCVVAREMTKVFEEFYRGPLGEAAAAFRPAGAGESSTAKRNRPESVVRGEVTLLIEGFRKEDEEEIPEDGIVTQLLQLKAAGSSVSDATRTIVEASGLRKKKVYRLALDLWKDSDGDSVGS